MSASMNGQDYDPARGRWIPWAFAGGMLLVIAVNMVLVYYAVTTFTGVTVVRSYERGRHYDAVLEEAARQDGLGWRATVSLAGGRLSVAANDQDGRPLSGRVEGVLLRPIEGTELPLTFIPTGGGRWAAEALPPQAGQWEARLTLFGPNEVPFDIRRRVMAP